MKWKPVGEKMFSRDDLVLAQITRREINNRLISCPPPPPIKRKKSSSFPEEKKPTFGFGGARKTEVRWPADTFFCFYSLSCVCGKRKGSSEEQIVMVAIKTVWERRGEDFHYIRWQTKRAVGENTAFLLKKYLGENYRSCYK